MEITTEQVPVAEIREEKIISMPAGMPGFLGCKRFLIIEREETWPFYVYQCVDDKALSFYIMNPFLFNADYEVNLDQAIKEMRWLPDDRDHIKIYVIVNTTAGVPEKITANLLGPLIINTRNGEAVQLVLHNSPYSHKHLIFQEKEPVEAQGSKKMAGG
ncbi:MAG: flagellar assembly protein FliW [Pseudomonadota bacterium]